MRLLIVEENARAEALAAALEADRISVEHPPDGALPEASGDEIEQLAAALVAFEQLLTSDAPDAVLLAGSSNLALAAALVATKLQIPVVGLADGPRAGDHGLEMNHGLIERLADAMVDADASAVAAWLRGSQTI